MFLNSTKKRNRNCAPDFPGRQRGAVTMFSAILILILLTEMLIYAVQVGVFEQRKSGNEMRQKQAFHAAETGIQHAQEYLLANVLDLVTQDADGWLSTASGRWVPCPALTGKGEHPCYGEPVEALRDASYYYSFDDPAAAVGAALIDVRIQTDDVLPARPEGADPTETVTVNALLCLLNIDRGAVPPNPPVQGCLDKDDPNMNPTYFVVTLLARGQAECDANGDCAAEALVAQKLGSFGPLSGAGGPGVPLTSRSTFPPNGTAEIVPNPDAGGEGVPISSWLNGNTDGPEICNGAVNPLDPIGGSWTTCERHEWYGVDMMPDEDSPNGKYTCPTTPCKCASDERRLSYAEAGGDVIGMDIVIDPDFPCDLFEYTFKVDRADYEQQVKSEFTVITDCDELGPDSEGLIWVDRSVTNCTINSTTIGSPDDPVFLVSAAELTSLAGNAIFYGVMFLTDVEDTAAEFRGVGTFTIYGAVIIEGPMEHFTGTYQVVYNDDLIDLATKRGSLGKIYGGWTDFHEDWR